MLTKAEASKIINKKFPDKEIAGIATGPDIYIFGYKDHDMSGFDTVNVNTGEVGFLWMIDYITGLEDGSIKYEQKLEP